MAILKVAQIGHPVLRYQAQAITKEEILSPSFQVFLDDMVDTMREYDGAGLAAPQVHVPKQVAVIELEENPRYSQQKAIPLTIMINPRILQISSEQMAEDWEGCLSVEGMRGLVPRAINVEIEALDRDAKTYRVQASGFYARVIQHEYDHLLGQLFLDRMQDLKTLTTLQNFSRYWVSAEEED